MSHLCVFCGRSPQQKTKEHVLPSWLIEMTGDPKREAKFGLKKEPGLSPRRFSYNSFTVPACNACNQLFSELESRTKTIMSRVLDGSPISNNEFSILFDWFDKVRVALWLAHSILDKNFFQINLSFHVRRRLGTFDRILGVFKSDELKMGLSFLGTETPIFYVMPSSFSLVVNNYAFFNASAAFFIARRIGFPFPSTSWALPNSDRVAMTLTAGRERLMHPIIRQSLDPRGSYLFQPMFPHHINEESIRALYNTTYVKTNSIDWNHGIGSIFLQKHGRTFLLPATESTEWTPAESVPLSFFRKTLTNLVVRAQIDLFKNSASVDRLPNEQKANYQRFAAAAVAFNRRLINQNVDDEEVGA